jgi:hypothetical protein
MLPLPLTRLDVSSIDAPLPEPVKPSSPLYSAFQPSLAERFPELDARDILQHLDVVDVWVLCTRDIPPSARPAVLSAIRYVIARHRNMLTV